MSKLYQELEQLFKLRIFSTEEIPAYIKKYSQMGKFDEPKKVALLALLAYRVGVIEDRLDSIDTSLKILSDDLADRSYLVEKQDAVIPQSQSVFNDPSPIESILNGTADIGILQSESTEVEVSTGSMKKPLKSTNQQSDTTSVVAEEERRKEEEARIKDQQDYIHKQAAPLGQTGYAVEATPQSSAGFAELELGVVPPKGSGDDFSLVCPECNVEFKSKAGLRSHSRTHQKTP